MSITVTHDRGTRSVREMREIVDALLESIHSDTVLAEKIRELGVNPAALTPDSITVKNDGCGLDSTMVDVIITFGTRAILDVWRLVFLPRIKRRWGINAVGQETGENEGR